MNLFLISGEGSNFYVRELARKAGEHLNSVRKELENLERMGLIVEMKKDESAGADARGGGKNQRKYFQLNKDFALYPELRALFFKARILLEKSLIEKMRGIGQITYLALTGIFTQNPQTPADLLIVGRVNKGKLRELMEEFENNMGRSLNYSLMSPREFRDRRELTDRFLFNILENKKIELINKLI